jgi:hypothetical protein
MALLYAAPMTDLADLERRVSVLEAAQKETVETQKWMASTLGRIAFVQDEHTARLDRIESDVRDIKADLSGLRKEFRDFQTGQPAMIADVMREVMRERS